MPNDLPAEIAERDFNLIDFMEGRCRAWGMFQDRAGAVKRRFEIETVGQWVGDTFELNETFLYDDGTSELRTWRITKDDEQSFRATCADSVGEARGELSTERATMDYRFRLKLKDRTIDLDFADRFYPIGMDGVMNRTRVTKFGIRVGEVTAFFYREPVSLSDIKPSTRFAA
ncbi:MAG: DUF3833 family protein [Pseudomonadota bacterium]